MRVSTPTPYNSGYTPLKRRIAGGTLAVILWRNYNFETDSKK